MSHFPLKNGSLGFSFRPKLYYGVPSLFRVEFLFDATFSIVPAPFKQCLIAMVFDVALKIYVPVTWILMIGK